MIVTMDQNSQTRNYEAIIKKRWSLIFTLTYENIDSGDNGASDFSILTPIEFKERDDKIRYYADWKISK